MNKINKEILVPISGIIFGLLIMFYLTNMVIPKILTSYIKAAPSLRVSVGNSYVIGSKVLAEADGKDDCIVNVFVMDESGKGVVGRNVVLDGVDDIKPSYKVTDALGKAEFKMTSLEEGQFTINASVDGVRLPRSVKVTFRK